jgi:hypothetical protein
MTSLNNKGNVLLYAVIAMTAISVLGTGIYFLTTTSTFGGLRANQQNRAYQLALAGKDYALTRNLGDTATLYPSGRDFTFTGGDKFRLVISGDTITSTGIVNENTPYESRRTITVTKAGFSRQADVSFAGDIGAFASGVKTSQADFLTVDQTAKKIILGGEFIASQFGSVWYTGSIAPVGCQNGKCTFGKGFRAYYIFKMERYDATHIPHGFTFAIFNGDSNSIASTGGDIGMPELLGYGGDSCLARNYWTNACESFLDPAGKGIQPPKMAVEYDGRPNSGSNDYCNSTFLDNSNSRADGTRNHLSYAFWGSATTCASRESSPTYDDNRHGAGGGSNPINAVASDALDTSDYFTGYSRSPSWNSEWLYGTAVPAYAFRIEVQRSLTMNASSKYEYTMKAWIKNDCTDSVCSNYAGTSLSNTKTSYIEAAPSDSPLLNRTIELDQPSHDKFATFLFGWTAAAGAASREKVILDKFQIYFIK